MDLSSLKPRPGSKHRVKRLGSGESSGHGKTCGKGHKGQKARSGGSIRLGFEGGQMPLARRIPKRGFNNARFKKEVHPVNLSSIPANLGEGTVVDLEFLLKQGIVRDSEKQIKILGDGEVSVALIFRGLSLSASARSKVIHKGGKVE